MAIFFIFWLLMGFGVAALANARGRSAAGFFLLSIFMSPILGLIVVLVTKNLKEEEAKEKAKKQEELARDVDKKREHESQLEALRALASSQNTSAANGFTSIADEIMKLSDLKDKGVLSFTEFEDQKKRLLGNNLSP